MIVREENEELVCVTQREHAVLSERLYETIADSVGPVAAAINHHDDGWEESDQSPSVNQGEIVDYRSVPLEEHLAILRRSARRSARHHPYAGWLVSRHGCSFHEEKSGEPVESFLAEQRQYRRELRELSGEALFVSWEEDFNWLQFTDAVSLFALDPWTETLRWDRSTPGPTVLEPVDSGTVRFTGDWKPDDPLQLHYSARRIPAEATESAGELRRSLSRTEPGTESIRLVVP